MRDFQWYFGGGLGPIFEPKPANLPSYRDPDNATSYSFCPPSIKNLQRHQLTPPSAETIPLICLLFELSVRMVSALGVGS